MIYLHFEGIYEHDVKVFRITDFHRVLKTIHCSKYLLDTFYLPVRVPQPGLLTWLSGKESTCQCRRHGSHP